MAQKKTNTSKSNSKRSTGKAQKEHEEKALTRFFKFFLDNRLGQQLVLPTVLILLTLFNFLLSGDHLEGFAVLVGLEILIAIVIGWTVYLYRRHQATGRINE